LELIRGGNMSQGSGLGRPAVADPPLSPISETPPPVLDDAVELLQVSLCHVNGQISLITYPVDCGFVISFM